MSIERIYLLLSVIVSVVFLTSGSMNNVFAVDYMVFDENSCKAFPGNFDSWNVPTSTCSRTDDLTINLDDTLIIPNGVTLKFPSNRDLINFGEITNNGLIDLSSGGSITNRATAKFTNSGVIQLNGNPPGNSILENRDNAIFINTHSGIISLLGNGGNRGQLQNEDSASFTNSGTITITGTSGNSGQLRNEDSASFTNSGTITITGTSGNSGQLKNNNNLFVNVCGIITFVSMTGNLIQEDPCTPLSSSGSDAYEDPTIGKSHNGRQVVENGICIDIQCWTVTADYHQDFELVEIFSYSTHTISTTVFCQNGVVRCNYVAFGVSPYGTNINDSVWKIILQKDHKNDWTMTVIDPDEYLGEVTTTTQIVNDGKHLSASATIEFKKPTPGMILNVEVRDSKGGYRDFKFNDGIAIADAYAYPQITISYDPPLELKPLCLNENPNKRYTCAFAKVKEWTIKNAEATLEQINK